MKAANSPGHPAPKAPGETPRSLPPPDSAAARAAVPPAHVGPAARAPPHPLPGPHGRASHTRRGPAPEVAPPARTPSVPGSAATSRSRGLQAGRVPPPGPGRLRAQPGRTRRPRRQHGPAAPTTGAALTATAELRFLRPMQAWLCPQSIHAPGHLLGTLTQPPRSHCERAAVGCPVSGRADSSQPQHSQLAQRGAPAPADQRLLSRTAQDARPRPALVAYAERQQPIGPRAVARAGLGLSNSGRERGAGGRGRGGVTMGHSPEPGRTGPSRSRRGAGTGRRGGMGPLRPGEGRGASRCGHDMGGDGAGPAGSAGGQFLG